METAVYLVEWLRDRVVIQRERLPSSAKTLSQAIQAAHIQAIEAKARLADNEPDSFRLLNENEKEFGIFQLRK
jgi:hypothetical protein